MSVTDVVQLLGGVALFLFGMSLMGDGLKRVAGNKLELILYRLSSTPLRGIFLGAGVTTVIQSSSATSVMVVGFVNSGMMRLRQAIAVIMGAVVGTSVTGWIICLSSLGGSGASSLLSLLSTENLSGLVAIAGILLCMVGKKKSTRHIGDILMGFAVLMFGMKSMSGAVEGLRESDAFLSLLTNFSNPVLGILAGFLITAVLQSASASVGILQALSTTGLLALSEVLPIILGIAIGASVPVLLSGLGSSTEGRRASVSYLVLEICRVILFAAVFYGLNSFLHFSFMNHVMDMFSIALLNTLFRLSTVLLLAPAIPLLEKLVCLLVPVDPASAKQTEDMNRLEDRFLAYPTLAVEQTRLTMNKMAELAHQSMTIAMDLLTGYDEARLREVQQLESVVDRYEDKIGSYLFRLTGRELTETQNKAVSQYLRAITDLERISDHALNIAERAEEIHEKKIHFTEKADREISNLVSAVTRIIDITFEAFLSDDVEIAYRVEPLEQVIDQVCRKMREKHAARLQKGKCTIVSGYVFNDLLVDFERVSDHCSNIAIVIVELLDNALDVHEMSESIRQDHLHQYEEHYQEYAVQYLKKVAALSDRNEKAEDDI